MKLEELAALMGKTIEELKEDLRQNDVIELKLTEKPDREIKDNGNLEIME